MEGTRAVQTIASATKASAATPTAGRSLQRACACGKHAGNGGECAECRKKRLGLPRPAVGHGPDGAPPIVHEVLRSPGRPLDDATRGFMESRFNHDFSHVPATAPRLAAAGLVVGPTDDPFEREAERQSQRVMRSPATGNASPVGPDFSRVRVHTDSRAAESASALNALAYTVGNHVVFGAGQYAPGTNAGRQLLAHELTHFVQQGRGSHQVQRWADCTPPRLSGQDCPPRDTGEVQGALSSSMYLADFSDPASGSNGKLVVNFDIGSAAIKPNLHNNQDWKDFLSAVKANGSRWRLLGFSDCQGPEAPNAKLRKDRAIAVSNAFPPQIRSQILSQEGAPIHNCITENWNARQRSLNRCVALIYDSASISFPGETIKATPPTVVCGPDVTTQVVAAVFAAEAAFAGWSSEEKEEACDALDSLSTGYCAWDIIDLHSNAWIYRNYRPTCATQGAAPPCGSSVQVGAGCHYAGSANYVIFGKMCRLCADYYLSIRLINTGYYRFTRRSMESLINLYKGTGFTGFGTPSANFRESVQWANAGYDGWPSGGSTPPGDRPNCAPMCPTPYSGPTFRIEWAPHIDPYNCS